MSEINVTPMVDVMLVLLIIFMVTAPLLTAGIDVECPQPDLPKVDLPKTEAGPVDAQKQAPSPSPSIREGKIFLQNTEIGFDELGAKTHRYQGRRRRRRSGCGATTGPHMATSRKCWHASVRRASP